MSRVALLVGIVLSTAGAQYSCSSDGTGVLIGRDLDSGHGPTFSTTLTLRDSAGNETYRFSRLELIDLEIAVRNRSGVEVTVHMPSTAGSEFFVFAEGEDSTLWRSNEDQAFPNVITEIVFQPYETRKFGTRWNQERRNGSFLPLGRYEVRGALLNLGSPSDPLAPHELGSNLRVFTID